MQDALIAHREAAPPASRAIQTPPSGAPLNYFQQAMLLWDEVHPYNAVHAVRLPGRVDLEVLQRAVAEACRDAGLGEIHLDRFLCRYSRGAPIDIGVERLPPAERTDDALRGVLAARLNEPFPRGPHHPIRWAVLEEPSGETHHVVLSYHHVVCDAASVEMLLACVLRRYLAAGARRNEPLPEAADEAACRALNPRISWAGFIRAWAKLGLLHKRLLRVHRMPEDTSADDSTSVVLRSAPTELYERLSAACRSRGIGLNDAFMAALAHAIALHTPQRRHSFWRRRIAIGTVQSGRKWLPAALANVFGVCLADLVVVVNRPDAGLERVLDQIVAQTRRLKADWPAAVAGTAIRVLFVRRIWPLLGIRNRRSSYRRSFPVCGGVSTVIVEGQRFGEAAAHIERYVRAAPPGPAVPIVLAPTIFNGRLELCLIYRKATLDPVRAASLLNDTIRAIEELSH